MAKLNIEFMDDSSGFFSKIEDDLENNINDLLDNYSLRDMPWDRIGWNVFEQLFPNREFLFAWYPFTKGARILEIGGGVGAITGFLCKRAQKVVTIEKKRKRVEIIRKKYKNVRNLEVIHGNFIDYICEEKFDYIIVHDIFGYLKKYIKDEKPYENFIKYMLSMMADDGKILLSTENRLGMKYYSGAIEDYSNKYFVGVDNFDGYDVIYTPTKKEIQRLLESCGIVNYKFYYPFPDSIFPTEIFTSESMEYLIYGGRSEETGWDRFELFDEREMYETLQRDNIVENFANAFIVEIGKQNNLAKINYCRMLDREASGFFKYIMIAENEYFTSTGKVYVLEEGSISLHKRLSDLFFEAKRNDISANECSAQIYNSFKKIKLLLEQRGEEISDIYTEEFVGMFGNEKLREVTKCIKFCEINTKNIFCKENEYILFLEQNGCMVPVDYLIWTLIYEWHRHNVWGRKSRAKLVELNRLYEICSLCREDIPIFKEWRKKYVNKLSRHIIEEHYVGWYKQNFIYPVDAVVNGDLIMKKFVEEENERSQLMREKDLLDELR